MINYIYSELHLPINSRRLPNYPDKCPLCDAGIDIDRRDYWDGGPIYSCGGTYTFKSQIQNHTDKWWGSCPIKQEEARLERGRTCDGCGEKRLEGTGFPITSFGWTCNGCGHVHKPKR